MVILYLDTSALVKLVIDEPDSSLIEAALLDADVGFTHPLARVEAHSAIERRRRAAEGLSEREAEAAGEVLAELWPQLARTPFDDGLLDRAVSTLRRHGLRAYDSLHLAAALWVRDTGGAEAPGFACHDGPLRHAASAEGLTLVPDGSG